MNVYISIVNDLQDFLTAEAQRAQRIRSQDLVFQIGLL
jgi:hypothetical protein